MISLTSQLFIDILYRNCDEICENLDKNIDKLSLATLYKIHKSLRSAINNKKLSLVTELDKELNEIKIPMWNKIRSDIKPEIISDIKPEIRSDIKPEIRSENNINYGLLSCRKNESNDSEYIEFWLNVKNYQAIVIIFNENKSFGIRHWRYDKGKFEYLMYDKYDKDIIIKRFDTAWIKELAEYLEHIYNFL